MVRGRPAIQDGVKMARKYVPKGKPKLTPKQELFVKEYLRDFNATQAALRAGYKHINMGRRLVTFCNVAEAIDKGKKRLLDTLDISAERALRELARLAFSDVRNLYDEQGNLIPIHKLDDDAAATVASVEVVAMPSGKEGEGDQTVYLKKIKQWDKTANLQNMLKHFGMLIDRSESKVTLTFGDILANVQGKTRGIPDPNEEMIND